GSSRPGPLPSTAGSRSGAFLRFPCQSHSNPPRFQAYAYAIETSMRNNTIAISANQSSASNATANGYRNTISMSKTMNSNAVMKYLIDTRPPPAGWGVG